MTTVTAADGTDRAPSRPQFASADAYRCYRASAAHLASGFDDTETGPGTSRPCRPAVTRDRSLSAQFEHTVAVTETGAEILTLSPKGYHHTPYGA